MGVHCYIRASTNKQHASPEVQREILAKYCADQNLDHPLWYTDAATSGGSQIKEREAGSQLMRNLKRGDHVVISKLDRAFRRASDCLVVIDQFERLGVHLHICNFLGGAVDLSKPIYKGIVQILAVVAEMERAFIRERIADGMRAKRQRGECIGRAPGYGKSWEKRTVMRGDGAKKDALCEVPNEDERAAMRLMLKWREEGMSLDQIRQRVQYELKWKTPEGTEWSEMRIKRAIRREMLLRAQEKEEAKSD